MNLCEMEPCDLKKIADSGQCFRWRYDSRYGYHVNADGNDLYFVQRENHIGASLHGCTGVFAGNYLDCGFDYDKAYREIIDYNPELKHVYEFGHGIRILNQPWFETAVTFIVSQNNNIPRIGKTVWALCDNAGDFPSPANLVEMLTDGTYGLGYRREYVDAFADKCAGGWKPASVLNDGVSVYDQMDELMAFTGIGPKVASCICLYGLGYKDVFPEDVWIKRAEKEMDIKWHPSLSGLQQQLVFYWMRNRPLCGDDDVKGGRR